MNDTTLFRFEGDFVDSLRCIPMAVRFKLDAVGIKLTLRQWNRLAREDRQALLERPCETAGEAHAYRQALCELIARSCDEPVQSLAAPPEPHWRADRPPPEVQASAEAQAGAPIGEDAWRGLTTLQRFALGKLSHPGHENENFAPAMREFGLA